MSHSTVVSSPINNNNINNNNNNGVVPETAIERVLFNGYLCSVLVIAAQDLEVLKILRRLCKKSGLYEPGPERYWNRHCITSMYRVTAEVTKEHRRLYYHDLYRGDLLRRETLPFGYGIVDLCVEMFDETGHITFRAYQNDTSYYEGMLSVRLLKCGYDKAWRVTLKNEKEPRPQRAKTLGKFSRVNYPLEPSFWQDVGTTISKHE